MNGNARFAEHLQLPADSEMGNLFRKKDWSTTPLGHPDQWPQSLKITLNILFNSKFPMFLFWGPQLTCFYNDAYRPSLGREGKHPMMLGMDGERAWPEIWHIIKPLIDKVINEKESVWFEDRLVPIYRNGSIEDVYWTFSYSPVFGASETVDGVLVTCTETTEKLAIQKKLEAAEQTAFNLIAQTPIPMVFFRGPEHIITIVNSAMLKRWNKTKEELTGKRFIDVFPQMKSERIPALLDEVYKTGKVYRETESVSYVTDKNGQRTFYVDFEYSPLLDADGTISGIIAMVNDVTDKVEARKKIEESEQRFRNTVKQAPVGITILRGKDFIVDMANDAYLQLVDKKEADFIGKPLFGVLPEVKEPVQPLLLNVLETGTPHHGAEFPVTLNRYGGPETCYFDFLYHPLKDHDGRITGIIVTTIEVSSQVQARLKTEESALFNRTVLESSPDSIKLLDTDGKITFINVNGVKVLGGNNSDFFIGRRWETMWGDEYQALITATLAKALAGQSTQFRAPAAKLKGVTRWWDVTVTPITDANKKVISILASSRDVTDEMAYARDITESEQRFRLLANSMPQHVWTADPQGNLNYYNQSVFDYTGLTKEQILKDGWLQIVHPDDREQNATEWMEAVTTGNDFFFEHRFRRHTGEYRWQLSRAIPQRDASGKIHMWVGTSTDIQEIKELEDQKDLFIGMASHELKTPLTVIKGYVQVLLEEQEPGKDMFRRSLAVIDKQVVILTNLISDLLDLSKIKSDSLSFNKETFPLSEVISEITGQVGNIYPEHTIVVQGNSDARVLADRNRIGQVLINFLTNAVKYAPAAKEIQVWSEADNDSVIVYVKDFGIGIKPADQMKVFDRFYRVEGKNETKFAGFGIGLFIASEIIRRHDGEIGVTSKLGEGSVFYFSLPVIRD